MRTFQKYASTAVFQQFSRDPITKEIPPPLLGTWIYIPTTSDPLPFESDSPLIHEKEHSIQVIPVLFKISRPESFKLFEMNFELRWHLHLLVTSCQQFIPSHSDSWNSCFWFVKKQGVLGQQQNAQGTNTYDTMNEIFKEDGIFDNLPSVSILRKIHFYYHDFNIVQKPLEHLSVTNCHVTVFRVRIICQTTFILGYFQVFRFK